MARRGRNAMVRSPNPCLATYSRRRNFWHYLGGLNRHPSNACVVREYPASTRWRAVTGNGSMHPHLTQLARNSGPKHITQTPQTEILILALRAYFFQVFQGNFRVRHLISHAGLFAYSDFRMIEKCRQTPRFCFPLGWTFCLLQIPIQIFTGQFRCFFVTRPCMLFF